MSYEEDNTMRQDGLRQDGLFEVTGTMPRPLPKSRARRRDNLIVYGVLLTIIMCGLLMVLMAAALQYTPDSGQTYVALFYAGLVVLAVVVIWWCR